MTRVLPRASMLAFVCVLAACADTGPKTPPDAATKAPPTPVAPPARAQDDMYRHVNRDWVANQVIPADRAVWGTFPQLRDDTLTQLRQVVDTAASAGSHATTDQRKIAALYASYLDGSRRESLGARPLAAPLREIDAMQSKRELPTTIGRLQRNGIGAPYTINIGPDPREPREAVPTLVQGGLGLPDREYYLRDDDAKLKDVRGRYPAHVAKLLSLAGIADADAQAAQVVDVETRLARVQWTRVQNRDPIKTYNKVPLTRLDALTPGYAWKPWLAETRIDGKVRALVIAQPSYLEGFAKVVESVPLDAWKAYFRYRVVSSYAPLLSKAFVEEDFAFNRQVLTGTEVDLPQWKRAIGVLDSAMGHAMGRLYVETYFPADYKTRIDALVKNVLAAYKTSIDQLDWMGPHTKREAQAKLAKFTPKIAYPVKWRDYGALTIRDDDLMGNVVRARRFEYERNLAKLGKPIDRTEWNTTPQTVNAYYSGQRNEVVFPAGILQPPFFDPQADDATNYGAIGSVIGHEISHGFDDRGSQSDGDGRLRNWWTDEDRKRFNARTLALIAQYDAFEPLPGYHVNGSLTLGENIADNSGIAVAYRAYRRSLNGKPAPVIDGLTGDQRFFIGFARLWRNKARDAERIRLIKVDPHSPGEYRTNGTLRNQAPFYSAFDVKPGDGMYLPPEKRVTIW